MRLFAAQSQSLFVKRDLDQMMKSLVTAAAPDLLPQLGLREPVREWLKSELAAFRRKADLIGRLRSGRILHFELQARNDPYMVRRMLEYAVRISSATGQIPLQFVLYFGWEKMRMRDSIVEPGLTFRYRLIDMRQLDADALLRSSIPEANLLALLADASLIRSYRSCAHSFAPEPPPRTAIA